MSEVMERMPPVGWYPESSEGSTLRWWDGDSWTDHVQEILAEVVVGAPAVGVQPTPGPETAGLVLNESVMTDDTRERIASGYTAHTEIVLPGLSTTGLGKNTPGAASWWDTSRQPAPSTSSTASVWALAFTPWIAALASVGAALVHTLISPQVGALIAGTLVPLLWMLATAVQDRKSLLRLGFQKPVSEWWILLGPLGYMIARTIRVVGVIQSGRAPLVLLLINTVAVPLAVLAATRLLREILVQF